MFAFTKHSNLTDIMEHSGLTLFGFTNCSSLTDYMEHSNLTMFGCTKYRNLADCLQHSNWTDSSKQSIMTDIVQNCTCRKGRMQFCRTENYELFHECKMVQSPLLDFAPSFIHGRKCRKNDYNKSDPWQESFSNFVDNILSNLFIPSANCRCPCLFCGKKSEIMKYKYDHNLNIFGSMWCFVLLLFIELFFMYLNHVGYEIS